MILNRDRFLDALNGDWAILPDRLKHLSPSKLQAYLEQQGYPGGPNGLLGHIFSWWEDGSQVVERMRREPAFDNPDYDVDSFNARAIERFASLTQDQMVETYQTMRVSMVALVNNLSDSELLDERINNRLRYEVIVHLEEHPLPSP